MFGYIFTLFYKLSRRIVFADHILYLLFHCIIPRKCKIGKNVVFNHSGLGTVLHPNASIGDNCWIEHHVLLGQRNGESRSAPVIENNCVIGAYAIILGGVIVGEGSVIGAGTIITKDVPAHSIVYNSRELIIRENHKPIGKY